MESIKQTKEVVEYYLTLSIKQQFNLDLDLKDEFILTENLVSKKLIIAPTFSEKILNNPEIKDFLHALISDINNEDQPNIVVKLENEPIRNVV